MDNQDIYYKKKLNTGLIVKLSIFIVMIATIFYLFNFFNINPCFTLSAINKGNMSPAYGRDYIISIADKNNSDSFPELQVIINETTNTDMSESIQHISLDSENNVFEWDRFFKFDTALIKTPYDARYIKFEDFNSNYFHEYPTNKSNLGDILIKHAKENTNILFDLNDYEHKKLNVNLTGESFEEKIKLHYTINFDKSDATKIFDDLYNTIWNSKSFTEFFKTDDDIQQKLGKENSTKNLLNIIYNIKENSTVNSLKVGIVANNKLIESIIFDFDISFNNGESVNNLNISLAEYIKFLPDETSPEDSFETLSIVDFTAISKHENKQIGDEIDITGASAISNSN